jgi:hypothetical protein
VDLAISKRDTADYTAMVIAQLFETELGHYEIYIMDTINQTPHAHTPVPEKKTSKFVHVSIVIAIVIVLNLFANYAVSLIYKEPTYETFVKPATVI